MKREISLLVVFLILIHANFIQSKLTNQEFLLKERNFNMNWREAQELCKNSTKEKGLLYKENMEDWLKIDQAMGDKRQDKLWVNFITKKPGSLLYWESGISIIFNIIKTF